LDQRVEVDLGRKADALEQELHAPRILPRRTRRR
jgi:hypothetical protein